VEEDRVDGQYRCCWAGVGGKGGKGIRQVAPGGGGGGRAGCGSARAAACVPGTAFCKV
jgi:hypothetical protein